MPSLSFTIFTYTKNSEQLRLDRLVVDASAICVSSKYGWKYQERTWNKSWESREIDSSVSDPFFSYTAQLKRTDTRKQIRRESRFCRDRGSRMSSCRSSRSRNESSYQDMLPNVSKPRMVCPWNVCIVFKSRKSSTRTSHNLCWRNARVCIFFGGVKACRGFVRFYVLSTKSQIWWQDRAVRSWYHT